MGGRTLDSSILIPCLQFVSAVSCLGSEEKQLTFTSSGEQATLCDLNYNELKHQKDNFEQFEIRSAVDIVLVYLVSVGVGSVDVLRVDISEDGHGRGAGAGAGPRCRRRVEIEELWVGPSRRTASYHEHRQDLQTNETPRDNIFAIH